jgi:DNA-binding response OmpR family regulator
VKILLVEDESAHMLGYVDSLRASGHEVDEAVTRDQAVRMIAENRYDAAAIDLILPGAMGDTVAEAANARGLGIVLMSASDRSIDDVKATLELKGCRVSATLRKPFTPKILLLALEQAARETKDRRADPVRQSMSVEAVTTGGRS